VPRCDASARASGVITWIVVHEWEIVLPSFQV
jgi:hypothetical protein